MRTLLAISLAALVVACSTETDAQRLARLNQEYWLARANLRDFQLRHQTDSLLVARMRVQAAEERLADFVEHHP